MSEFPPDVQKPAAGNGWLPENASRQTCRLTRSIANFKVPKRVHFVDELPRNAMGKVQKNLLRSRFASA